MRRDQTDTRANRTADATSGAVGRRQPLGRRDYLVGAVAVGATVLTGCLQSQSTEGETPNPVSLDGGTQCDVCGMTIADHPGPTGQIFYRDHSPSGHDNPAVFDSVRSCLFSFYFEHERKDWTASVVYVSDYSQVDYDISEIEGNRYIDAVTAAEYYVDAETVEFVVESEIHGAMGTAFVPFSDTDDAEAFVENYGGRTVRMEDITPALIGQ